MKKIIPIQFQNRSIHLYEKKEDIERKGNIKIMQHQDKGFFYIEHNRCYDVHGQFDLLFDQGSWKKSFLDSSKQV